MKLVYRIFRYIHTMFPEKEILMGVNGPISYQIYFYRCRKNLMKIEDQKRLLLR